MSSDDTLKCRRCDGAPFIILEKIHVECKDCFMSSCHRKFKQTLGKSKSIDNRDPVLVAYSGGQSSSALLDMLKCKIDATKDSSPKTHPSILHIDMQILFCDTNLSDIETSRLENLNILLAKLKQKYPGWPIYWSSIESCMSNLHSSQLFESYESSQDIYNKKSPLLMDVEARSKLKQAIAQVGDLTNRQLFVTERCMDLVEKLSQQINLSIESSAAQFKYVLVGNSATQLANKLLVDVIIGRGSTIRSTVNVLDDRALVPILRPLRDFSKKEIVFYLRAKNMNVPIQPNFLTKADRKACIQTATETFLSKLYLDYPATYTTLLKTSEKLANK